MRQLAKAATLVWGRVYEYHCLAGYPADQISAFAAGVHADLIVMGSHGRTGVSRLLTGSVAERVMRPSKWPVLVVKAPIIQQTSSVPAASESAALRVTNVFAI